MVSIHLHWSNPDFFKMPAIKLLKTKRTRVFGNMLKVCRPLGVLILWFLLFLTNLSMFLRLKIKNECSMIM